MVRPPLFCGYLQKLSANSRRFTIAAGFCLGFALLSGCATGPPTTPNDICSIFDQKRGWQRDARRAAERWQTPVPVLMAFIYQESRFEAHAKPPRKKILWVIPGARPSDAYGYPQALDSTWRDYQRAAGGWGADRDDFGDSVDFVGWYNHQSWTRNRIPKTDAYNLYLAYHEGQGGYARGTYKRKAWLQAVAKRVARQSKMYADQLLHCR